MSRLTTRPGRFLLVMLMVATWFSISNHCTLGCLVPLHQDISVAPMCCHGDTQAPPRNGNEQELCCRGLKAITIEEVDIGTRAGDFALKDYPAGELVVEIWRAHTHTLGVDTGPPKAVSFSEAVLQRSILAHAPPFSLS